MAMEQISSGENRPHVQIFVFAGQASNAGLVVASSVATRQQVWYSTLTAAEVDWLEFSLLAAQWKRETGLLSSRTKKVSSRLYRRIMEMGRDRAVPQIIRQIQMEGATPNHWWPALQELTGEDPVPAEAKKDIREVARYWIEWGRLHYGGELGGR
jgi:hypothetical protein